MKNFIIVTTQRSGSTWLTDLLDSHPQIICSGEIYKTDTKIRYPENSYRNYYKQNLYRKLMRLISPTNLIAEHLGWYFTKIEDKSCGFKIMLDQLKDKRIILEKANIEEYAIIVLTRENIVERMISKRLASKNNLWITEKNNNKLNPLKIDIRTLLDDLNVFEKENESLNQIAEEYNCLSLNYNNLKRNTQESLDSVIDYLGIDKFDGFDSKIKKIVKNDFRSLIENYDDFALTIKGTQYEHYLSD